MQDQETKISKSISAFHIPVMPNEISQFAKIKGRYIDLTVGSGGHSKIILEADAENTLLGIDCSIDSLNLADKRLNGCGFSGRFTLVRENFRNLKFIAQENKYKPIGILADLGFSSLELSDKTLGLSFETDQPLDMRMDRSFKLTAATIVNNWNELQLFRLLQMVNEKKAGAISHAILRRRKKKAIATTLELAGIISSCYHSRQRIHPATKMFLALRIIVNDEINNLKIMLRDGFELLDVGGKLAVISFNSLEDRIVKKQFQSWAKNQKAEIIYKKGIVPAEDEKRQNKRSRSARLRIVKCVTI